MKKLVLSLTSIFIVSFASVCLGFQIDLEYQFMDPVAAEKNPNCYYGSEVCADTMYHAGIDYRNNTSRDILSVNYGNSPYWYKR